jgi:hypothetical protein
MCLRDFGYHLQGFTATKPRRLLLRDIHNHARAGSRSRNSEEHNPPCGSPPIILKSGASLGCKGRTACSSVHVLLWVRECSQGLFVLLDLAACVHGILYLRTRR